MEYETQELEQAILGQVMKNPDCMSEIGTVIQAGDFFSLDHQNIFSAIEDLYENKKPVTVISAYALCAKRGQIFSSDYLKTIVANTASARNVTHYAGVLAGKAKERKIYQAAQSIMDLYEDPRSADDKLDIAQALLMAIGERKSADVHDMPSILKNVVKSLEERFEAGGEILGLPSGFKAIDERIGGYRGSDLIIIAGRPGMGKTTFGMNIAEKCALAGGRPLIFSLEMSKEQLAERSICSIGNIPLKLMRSGQVMASNEHCSSLSASIGRMIKTNMKIIEKGAISIGEMKSISRRENRKSEVSMVLVDYLQLMDSKAEGQVQKITEISGGLKALAKELDCPVFALSQLNRSVESRPNKRPVPSDLRDSGAIEQDADIIHFLYRDVVYDPNTNNPNVTEVGTAKFRHGETGTDLLASELHVSRFVDFHGTFIEDEPVENKRGQY
ncbi:replicative DNA helicase [Candidatus Pacearchaeota archaeon]|nr:replicative DNA helicase [Candidatus Pacearchaeota archaeon]